MKNFKHQVYNMLFPKGKRSKASIVYDCFMFVLISISSACVFIELFGLLGAYRETIHTVEYVITCLFIFEYLIKLWLADLRYPNYGKLKSRIEFITSFESFIDLISIFAILFNGIPSELMTVKLIKSVKLVRLFKFTELTAEDGESERADSLKRRVYEIMCKDTAGDFASRIYDIFSIVLIFVSVLTLIVDTFSIQGAGKTIIHSTEYVIAILFTIEYVARVWTSSVEYPDCDADRAKMKYIFSFMSVIDLLSILPVFLTGLDSTIAIVKILKLFKILRLVKMSRYLSGINRFALAINEKRKQILFSMTTIMFLMVLCSVFIYTFEHASQPQIFKNAFSGIVYSFVTLTGIGDTSVELVTSLGKTFSTIMTVLGVCIFAVPVTIVTEEFMSISKEADKKEEKEESDESEEMLYLDISALSAEDRKLIKDFYDRINQNRKS